MAVNVLEGKLKGRTLIGYALDKVPFKKMNAVCDWAAKKAGFSEVGNWRRDGIKYLGGVSGELFSSLHLGLGDLPDSRRPDFIRGKNMGAGGVNAPLIEDLEYESAFGLGAILAQMRNIDGTNADTENIKSLLALDSRVLGDFSAGLSRPIAALSIGAPGNAPPIELSKKEASLVNVDDLAARRALYAYIPGAGTLPTREAIAKKLGQIFSLDAIYEAAGDKFSAANIFVAGSCKEIQELFFMAATKVGDNVIVMSPYFPMHWSVPNILGRRSLTWEPNIKAGKFSYSIEDLKAMLKNYPRTSAIVLSYPGNPAPFMFNEQQLKEIVDLCAEQGVKIFVDAPYYQIMCPGSKYPNIFTANPKAKNLVVMAHSESKGMALPGRRIGHAIAPAGMVDVMSRLAINFYSCPNVMNDTLLRWIYLDLYGGF